MDAFSDSLRDATLKKIMLFDTIRGKSEYDLPFWDVVVLTALDESQKDAYDYQLKEKLQHKELPLNVKYHVFSDPVGKKVGNGGSTLVVIDELERIYSSELAHLKVLIIHAGGFSQRLPNASLLGKIFMCLPLGNPIYQMLELKLAMYIEFPSRMSGGMFVTSADTIEVYNLVGNWKFTEPGFTALGHPSPIEVGTTHGVFVLEKHFLKTLKEENVEHLPALMMGKCRKFLHKPSKENMRKSEAVFHKDGEEFIFSDSAFFISFDRCLHLLQWYRSARPLNCEIDAYGDFLQSLGPEGDDGYCENVANVTEVSSNLVSTRRSVFKLLHGSQLNVLLMNCSKFYHVGTFPEYIEHFCGHGKFRYELGTLNNAMVKGKEKFPKNVVVLHSIVESTVSIKEDCIIEHSIIKDSVCIESGCILSNVIVSPGLHVPKNSFFHTVCVRVTEGTRYATVCFSTADNLKKCVGKFDARDKLLWHSVPLSIATTVCDIPETVWTADCQFYNLWHAKLFPLFDSPEDSFQFSLKMATSLQSNATDTKILYDNDRRSRTWLSMAELLQEKDLMAQLKMRENLRIMLTS